MIDKLSFLLRAILKLDELPKYVETNKWEKDNILRSLLLPTAIIIAVELLITYCIYSEDFRIDIAIVKPILFIFKSCIAYVFFLKSAEYICHKYLNVSIQKEKLHFLLFLIYFTYLTVHALYIFMPSMFFIKFFYVYAYYQAWHTSNSMFDIDEKHKLQFTLIIPSLMFAMNTTVEMILKLLVPNIPI